MMRSKRAVRALLSVVVYGLVGLMLFGCATYFKVTDTATVQLIRGADCLRLDFTDTGIFDVSNDGRSMRWYPLPDSDPDAAALDVIGRVLAVCFHASGLVCLHGSAVALDSGTIAFLAPKFHGKSTTALPCRQTSPLA